MGRIGHDQRCARLKAKTSDYKHEKTIWRFAGIIALSIDYCDRCVLRWPRNLTGQQPLTTAQPHRTGAGKQLEMVRDVANFSRGFHGFVGLGKSLEKNTRIDSRKNSAMPRDLEMMRKAFETRESASSSSCSAHLGNNRQANPATSMIDRKRDGFISSPFCTGMVSKGRLEQCYTKTDEHPSGCHEGHHFVRPIARYRRESTRLNQTCVSFLCSMFVGREIPRWFFCTCKVP